MLIIKAARAKVRVQLRLMPRAFHRGPKEAARDGAVRAAAVHALLGAAWELPTQVAALKLLSVNPSNGPVTAFMKYTGKIKTA